MEEESRNDQTINKSAQSLERAESNIIKVLSKAAEVSTELSRLESNLTSETIKSYTQEIIELCRSIRQDMKVPLSGLAENQHLTNNLSVYSARKDLEISHMRTKLIYDMLSEMKPDNNNNLISDATTNIEMEIENK